MKLEEEEKKREMFRDILLELAKDQDALKDPQQRVSMFKRLETLYHIPNEEREFRHFYSDIFNVLTLIKNDSERGNINILGANLYLIRKGYKSLNFDENGKKIDITDSIRKLYDHVSLDIARISYSDAGERDILEEEKLANIRVQITQVAKGVAESKKTQDSLEKELNKQQREYIAILGIFAAVVLGAIGGIVFSTSVLENINTVTPYRIIILSLVIGIVIINIIFGLFYYIDCLVNGNERKKIRPLIISNIVMVSLLLLTVLAWIVGLVEYRNDKVRNDYVEDIVNEISQESFFEL